MPGRSFTSSSYRFGFNGKENDPETGTQDYGFRIYNSALGRFLSVDPLTKQYPSLTPYQFASNRPIDGIDLDGLEYLSANVARVEFANGQLQMKVENFNNSTQNAFYAANNNPACWATGADGQKEAGISRKVGDVTFFAPAYAAPDPGLADRTKSPSGNPGNPNASVPCAPQAPTAGIAKASIAVDAINLGLDELTKFYFRSDMGLVNEHSLIAQQAAKDVNNAIRLIPKEYLNQQSIVDITNVVLQGVNNTTDPKIMEIGMSIYRTYHPITAGPVTMTDIKTTPNDAIPQPQSAPAAPASGIGGAGAAPAGKADNPQPQ